MKDRHLTIRRVRGEEWPALRDLRLLALRTDPMAFGSTLAQSEQYDEAVWRERALRGATAPNSTQWVAVDGKGSLVGSIVISEIEGRVQVFGMWLAPEYRSRGIGGRLLDTALDWSGETFPGLPVILEVNPRQESALRLYASRGFVATGATRPLEHTPDQLVQEMVRPGRPAKR
jgi:RimJ/RimL family protein N-acetyltransferase